MSDTTVSTGRGPGAIVAGMDALDRLRFAALAFAQPPSSQRRWVQLGNMRVACTILDSHVRSVSRLKDDGVLTPEQARIFTELLGLYRHLRDTREDLLEEQRAAARAFLWSDALEDQSWHQIRHLAIDCYVALSEGRKPLIDE